MGWAALPNGEVCKPAKRRYKQDCERLSNRDSCEAVKDSKDNPKCYFFEPSPEGQCIAKRKKNNKVCEPMTDGNNCAYNRKCLWRKKDDKGNMCMPKRGRGMFGIFMKKCAR